MSSQDLWEAGNKFALVMLAETSNIDIGPLLDELGPPGPPESNRTKRASQTKKKATPQPDAVISSSSSQPFINFGAARRSVQDATASKVAKKSSSRMSANDLSAAASQAKELATRQKAGADAAKAEAAAAQQTVDAIEATLEELVRR